MGACGSSGNDADKIEMKKSRDIESKNEASHRTEQEKVKEQEKTPAIEQEPESFDDDENEQPVKRPSTATVDFDPTTLWRLKELKSKMKIKQEAAKPSFESN